MSVIRVGQTLAPATTGVSIEEAPAALLRTSTTPAQVSVLPPTASAVGGVSAEKRAIVGAYVLFGAGLLITGLNVLVKDVPDGRPAPDSTCSPSCTSSRSPSSALIEPVSKFVSGTGTSGSERTTKEEAEDKRATAINGAFEANDAARKKVAVDQAAAAQTAIDQTRANAVYWMWGVATLLGLLARPLGRHLLRGSHARGCGCDGTASDLRCLGDRSDHRIGH